MALKILYADDNKSARDSLAILLETYGHEVKSVASGAQLLAAISGDGVFDVIITDYSMPGGMSGIDVIRHIRAKNLVPSSTIVLHTAVEEEALLAEVSQLDCVFINKYDSKGLPLLLARLEAA